jgi:hypothetical protein
VFILLVQGNHNTKQRWASIGSGMSMANSTMIIGWKNSTNGYTISDRISTSKALPKPIKVESEIIPLVGEAPIWANLAFSFKRPLSTNDLVVSDMSTWIVAYGDTPPNDIDDPKSDFSVHTESGILGAIDFTARMEVDQDNSTNESQPDIQSNGAWFDIPVGCTFEDIIEIHGYVMIFAWIICPVIGYCMINKYIYC